MHKNVANKRKSLPNSTQPEAKKLKVNKKLVANDSAPNDPPRKKKGQQFRAKQKNIDSKVAVEELDEKINKLKSQDDVSKTSKRKLRMLKKLKNTAESKEADEKDTTESSELSVSSKRRLRRNKGNSAEGSNKKGKGKKFQKQIMETEESEVVEEDEIEDKTNLDDAEEKSDVDDAEEDTEAAEVEGKTKAFQKKPFQNNKEKKVISVDDLKNIDLLQPKQKKYVLFLGNLSYDTTKQDLQTHFEKIGQIKDIRLPTYPKTTKPRGFGYIEVESEESFQRCISMHNTFLKGRRVRVEYTQHGKKKSEKKKKIIKAKNFKLHAMRKQGMLAGSKKESQKRSFRRAKKLKASKEEGGEEN